MFNDLERGYNGEKRWTDGNCHSVFAPRGEHLAYVWEHTYHRISGGGHSLCRWTNRKVTLLRNRYWWTGIAFGQRQTQSWSQKVCCRLGYGITACQSKSGTKWNQLCHRGLCHYRPSQENWRMDRYLTFRLWICLGCSGCAPRRFYYKARKFNGTD